MPFDTVQLNIPQPINVRLYFDHNYAKGLARYDYLHTVRTRQLFASGWPLVENSYWSSLEHNRHEFAIGLDEDFDLIVDPPSNSCFHRPFLDAFLIRRPHRECLRFTKKTLSSSSIKDRAILAQNIVPAFAVGALFMGTVKRLLIVDDVFASGTICSIVVEKMVAAGLSPAAEVTIAAPLRVMTSLPDSMDAESEALLSGDEPDDNTVTLRRSLRL